MSKKLWKKDSYIVLLSSLNGDIEWGNLPINYCYQLSRDSYEDHRGFRVYRDVSGRENGWSNSTPYKNNVFRDATEEEIALYKKLGHPFKVDATKVRKLSTYNYLIPFIEQLNKNYVNMET